MSALRRVLVTGASRGIGRGAALRLATRSEVVAIVRREEDRASLEAASGGRVKSLLGDLATREGRAELVERAAAAFGPIDGLVHAAGLGEHRPIALADGAFVDRLFELNTFAAIDLVRSFVRARASDASSTEGSIVLVGSTLATRPAPATSIYAASKGALASLGAALAVELAPHVRVNTLSLGVFDTDMVRAPRLAPDEAPLAGDALEARIAAQLEGLAKLHLVRRLGHVDEAAEAIDFLLHARFATGSTLTLDGGISLA